MTLLSLLCAENWWWDSGAESYIRFHEDGTGEVSLAVSYYTSLR